MTPRDKSDGRRTPGHRLPSLRRAEPSATVASEAPASDATRAAPRPTAHPMPRDPDATQTGVPAREARQMVGRFEIREKIGEGGMGVVYRGIDTADPRRREVAVKVLRPHIAYDPQARTRLAREVQTLERVHHPNVAAVIAADPHGERPYIATEYVPGQPLDTVVAERGPFAPEQLAAVGRDLAGAVRAVHEAGVVHRDLKPSNVLMVGARPVVIDFGIAHIADDARLTSTGLVMGTPGYLSPELVEGAPVSTSTDWWGWAATLAFAAQGHPPFGRGPMPVVLDRVTRGQSDLAGVDARLRPLLAAALSPVPGERPSAADVVAQMERYGRGEPTTFVPVRRPQERPGRESAGAAGAGATSVLTRVDATRVAPAQPRPAPTPAVRREQGTTSSPHPYGAGAPARPSDAPPPAGRAVGRDPGAQQWQPPTGVPGPPKPQSRPGEHDPRITLPPRSGTLQALFVLWAGVTALVPLVGLALLVLWNLAARFTDSTVTQTVLRRYEAGRRRSDGAVALASSPWHAVRALAATVVALLLPALVFACVGAVTGIGYAAVRGGVPRLWWALPVLLGAVVAQFSMWRGVASVSYRRGSRSLVRALVPAGAAPVTVAVLAGLGVFMLLGAYLQGGDISWAPLLHGLTDPLAEYLPSGTLGG